MSENGLILVRHCYFQLFCPLFRNSPVKGKFPLYCIYPVDYAMFGSHPTWSLVRPRPLAGNSTVINAKDRKNKETSWEQFSPCENIRLVSISAKLVLHDPSQPKILEKLINNKLYSPTILLPKMKEK